MIYIKINELPESFSNEENLKVLKEIRNGREELSEVLVMHNLRLCLFVMNKKLKYYNGNDTEDIFQICTIGLIKAVNNFDIEKNILFSTFAIKCIENEINNYFRNNYKLNNLVSLNEKEFSDQEEEKIELLVSDINIEEEVTKKEVSELLLDAINSLEKERVKDAVIMYYLKGIPQGEIASKYNVSRQYVSSLLKVGLRRMKFYLRSKDYDYKLTLK